MILCKWDAPEGHPGQCSVHLYARILSRSYTSVSIFSVWCYSSISISVVGTTWKGGEEGGPGLSWAGQAEQKRPGAGWAWSPAGRARQSAPDTKINP
jgi:hypothetical protein